MISDGLDLDTLSIVVSSAT